MRSVRRKRITGRAERVKDREKELAKEGRENGSDGEREREKGGREGESEGRTYRIRVYAPKRGRPRRGSRSALTYCPTFVAQSSLPPNFVAERTQKPRTLPANPLRQPPPRPLPSLAPCRGPVSLPVPLFVLLPFPLLCLYTPPSFPTISRI